jgi:monoterpene epsilon-lactone hydrolase
LLSSKPRPLGWAERRQRIDEVGSVWPVAGDVTLAAVDLGGVPGEWSIVPGSDASRVIMFFHGGGYCSGSIRSHRRMVSEAGRAAGMRNAGRQPANLPVQQEKPEFADAWRVGLAAAL